jgi:hypothetical protein
LCFNGQANACESDEIIFPQSNVCSKLTWLVGPTFNQFNSVSIQLSETNLKLNVIPWMVMMGGHEHGSRPVIINEVSPSDYLIEKIYFMGGMHGTWFLRLQLVNEKKELVEEVRSMVSL